MSETCQYCYCIVDRACQSDTETLDCRNLQRALLDLWERVHSPRKINDQAISVVETGLVACPMVKEKVSLAKLRQMVRNAAGRVGLDREGWELMLDQTAIMGREALEGALEELTEEK